MPSSKAKKTLKDIWTRAPNGQWAGWAPSIHTVHVWGDKKKSWVWDWMWVTSPVAPCAVFRLPQSCMWSSMHPVVGWCAFIVNVQDLGRTQLCMASEQLEGAQLSPEEGEISEVKQWNKVPKTYDDQRKNIQLCSCLKEQLSGQASWVDPRKGSRILVLFQAEEGTVRQINPSYSRDYVISLLIAHFPANVSKLMRSRKTWRKLYGRVGTVTSG